MSGMIPADVDRTLFRMMTEAHAYAKKHRVPFFMAYDAGGKLAHAEFDPAESDHRLFTLLDTIMLYIGETS